jgi:hypothetical protein
VENRERGKLGERGKSKEKEEREGGTGEQERGNWKEKELNKVGERGEIRRHGKKEGGGSGWRVGEEEGERGSERR